MFLRNIQDKGFVQDVKLKVIRLMLKNQDVLEVILTTSSRRKINFII